MPTLYLRRFFSIICLCAILLSGCTSTKPQTNSDFESFTTTLFVNEVGSNTLNLQYTLESPEYYGIANAPLTLGSFQTDSSATLLQVENYTTALSLFLYSDLSLENKLTYDILFHYLDTTRQLSSYPLYSEPLSPYTGIHTQLPILLAEFPLRDSNDVELYLSLLETVPTYFQSLINFQQEKSKQGLFMSDSQLDAVIADCNAYLSTIDAYLDSSFSTRLESITTIPLQEIDDYLSQNATLITEVILPAYQNLMTELNDLRGSGKNSNGLYYLPQGLEYYEILTKVSTGSSRELSEIKSLIYSQISEDYSAIQELALDSSIDFQSLDTLPIQSPEEILENLQLHTQASFPSYPTVSTTIKSVPQEMETHLSPAFYLIPTIDNTSNNTIYINNRYLEDQLSLYTTLAHESYPGHLYQTTYFDSTNPNPLRQALSFGGYAEGWATYGEMCSYYFLELPSSISTLLQKNNSLSLGLYAYADIGIHYEGWLLDDAEEFFASYGLTDNVAVSHIYNLILATPTNYLKYYFGYIEILELKKQYIEKWGDDFTQEKFHKAVLDVGPAPFELIEKYID